MERRGHRVRALRRRLQRVCASQRRAGERVMALLRKLYGRASSEGEREQDAVARVFGRKFSATPVGGAGRRGQARGGEQGNGDVQANASGELTRASSGTQSLKRSGGTAAASIVRGWKAYFRLAQTPRVWRELDEWMRHRLRAIAAQALEARQDDLPGVDG